MKKIFYIVVISLFAIFLGGWLIHYLHRNSIVKQEVHRDSDALFILGLDNLMLKNTDWLHTIVQDDSDSSISAGRQLKDLVSKSGLAIPAKLFFFSLPNEPESWYTYSTIKDLPTWQKYLQSLSHTDTAALESEQPTFMPLNRHIAVLYNNEQVLWRITVQGDNSDSRKMPQILNDKNNRRPIRYFRGLENVLWDNDMVYTSSDAKKYIAVNMGDQEINIRGEWKYDTPLKAPFPAQQVDTVKQVISFWSNLAPFNRLLIDNLLTPLSEAGIQHADYLDLTVSTQLTKQLDTAIVYDYDENFNSIEKKEIIEQEVPVIHMFTSTATTQALPHPTKFFYNFYAQTGPHGTRWSTEQKNSADSVMNETRVPFYLHINFEHWPTSWQFGPFPALQKHKFVLTAQANTNPEGTLSIEGKVLSKK